MNTIEQTIKSLTSQGIVLGLERVQELLEKLENPQDQVKSIHVAGTNGKGSTCALISSVLTQANYKVGLFTSPFLREVNEIFQINGESISNPRLLSLLEQIQEAVKTMKEKPSEFELQTALAFQYFKEEHCDFMVIEVGLGGRLDATNLMKQPILSVITKIAQDHTLFIGDTLQQIAQEKGGIIKDQVPCVVMEQSDDILEVFRQIAQEKHTKITLSSPKEIRVESQNLQGITFQYPPNFHLKTPLIGSYQIENIATALKSIEILQEIGVKIEQSAIYNGFEQVFWPGRFQVLSHSPLFIVDGAHNLDGMKGFTHTLNQVLPGEKCTFLMGVMADKEYTKMVEMLVPFAHRFLPVETHLPRGLSAEMLKDTIQAQFSGQVSLCEDVAIGIKKALETSENHPICCVGSLYILGEVLQHFQKP